MEYKVLEPKKKNSTASTMDDETLYLKSGAAEAQGLITSEGFVLMAGAKINEKTAEKSLGKGTGNKYHWHLTPINYEVWNRGEISE